MPNLAEQSTSERLKKIGKQCDSVLVCPGNTITLSALKGVNKTGKYCKASKTLCTISGHRESLVHRLIESGGHCFI